ncbi:MAG: phospholipase A [Wolinella sp.]
MRALLLFLTFSLLYASEILRNPALNNMPRELTLWHTYSNGQSRILESLKLDEEEKSLEILLPTQDKKDPQILHITITKEPKGTPNIETSLGKEQLKIVDLRPEKEKKPLENVNKAEFERLYREYKDHRRLFGAFLGIEPYKENYLLPYSHSFRPREGEKQHEAKFQISFKTLLTSNIFGTSLDLYLAYTQRSFWQVYDGEDSRPFRESNYEPEIFFSYPLEIPLFGGVIEQLYFGLNHESNGKDVQKSRSWNRAFIGAVYNNGGFFLALKGWHRFKEKEKLYTNDPRGDDNPKIERYLGHGEMKVGYFHAPHLITATLRNNLNVRGENRGSILLDYSYPLQRSIHAYVQYFNGYGESLIDYDKSVERVGIGMIFTR